MNNGIYGIWKQKRQNADAFAGKAPLSEPDKHIDSFLRGIPLFTVVAVLAAGIVTVIG